MKHILFVCTGNTCRSPMAEALLRESGLRESVEVKVCSAGLAALSGQAASKHTMQVLTEKGISHEHTAQKVTKDLVQWADLILTMTMDHKSMIVYRFPESIDKVFSLKEYVGIQQDEEMLQLQQHLYQLYSDLQLKRLEIRNRFSLKGDDQWSEEAWAAWCTETIPLRQREEELISQLENKVGDLDIQDPFGCPVDVYRTCAQEMEEVIGQMVTNWKAEKAKE